MNNDKQFKILVLDRFMTILYSLSENHAANINE